MAQVRIVFGILFQAMICLAISQASVISNLQNITFSVSVFSLNGVKVADFIAADGYDLSTQPSGIYVVTWTTGGKTRSVKFRK